MVSLDGQLLTIPEVVKALVDRIEAQFDAGVKVYEEEGSETLYKKLMVMIQKMVIKYRFNK